MMALVILPQALRVTLPNIVNTFIGLFKDTTLVFVVGIFDFLRTDRSGARRSELGDAGHRVTGYAFAALFYFVCCYGMSRYARSVEARLGARASAVRGSVDGRLHPASRRPHVAVRTRRRDHRTCTNGTASFTCCATSI